MGLSSSGIMDTEGWDPKTIPPADSLKAMKNQFSNPKRIADAGERIYKTKFQQELEKTANGKFVAIDVISGSASMGETPEQALNAARKEDPKGLFHLIRVGFSGAFQLNHALQSSTDWLSR